MLPKKAIRYMPFHSFMRVSNLFYFVKSNIYGYGHSLNLSLYDDMNHMVYPC